MSSDQNKGQWQTLVKRFGIVGFLFFLVKGLVWVALFSLGMKGCNELRDSDSSGVGSYNPEISAHELLAFQRLDDLVFLRLILEVHKSETLGSSALSVSNDIDMFDFGRVSHQLLQMGVFSFVSEVPNVNGHSIVCYPIKHKN
jgi:hypothetical protein